MTLTLRAERQDFLDRRKDIPDSDQRGQASIEFLLTFAFGIGLTLLFVSLAINMTRGYMVHYANYMASRTFLSFDGAGTGSPAQSINSAEEKARDAFKRYPLAAFDIQTNFTVNKPAMNVSSSLMAGTYAEFSERITPFSLVGGSKEAVFRSESFLTKEPVRLQCLLSICQAMGVGGCNKVMDITVGDNGC